ncbi:hypothetical protein GCM10010365_45600 [Streptomyces poonensis]|uniref:Uncharacterized protein n=1 Tax=Streptomyces poonensis TaxID=68255 RepID=A0A918PRD3_9ACTN|nr:hypothetical protein GCM10010365_45600 [Streptomyces poonensis]
MFRASFSELIHDVALIHPDLADFKLALRADWIARSVSPSTPPESNEHFNRARTCHKVRHVCGAAPPARISRARTREKESPVKLTRHPASRARRRLTRPLGALSTFGASLMLVSATATATQTHVVYQSDEV